MADIGKHHPRFDLHLANDFSRCWPFLENFVKFVANSKSIMRAKRPFSLFLLNFCLLLCFFSTTERHPRARRRPPAEFRWKRLKQFSLEVLLEKNTALRACRRECRLILQKRYVRDDAEVRKSCRSHDMMQYE